MIGRTVRLFVLCPVIHVLPNDPFIILPKAPLAIQLMGAMARASSKLPCMVMMS